MRPNDHINSKQGCRLCSNAKKKITSTQFVSRAAFVHNNKYDYSLVVYSHNKIPVDIICPTHGMFSQKPNDHLNGFGVGLPVSIAGEYMMSVVDFIVGISLYVSLLINTGIILCPIMLLGWRKIGGCCLSGHSGDCLGIASSGP